jgi:hypothetical protein
VTKYTFPDLTDVVVIASGRRYKAFRVSKSKPFNGFEDDCDFVVWDGLYDAVVSCGQISSTGVFKGSLIFSHVELEVGPCESINDFIAETKRAQLKFFSDSGS